MKRFLLISLIAGGLLFGCKDSSEPISNMPAIQKISFAGLPDQNVTFDAANSVITVRMPPVVEGGLKPILELTQGAEPIGLLSDGSIDLTAFCRPSVPGENTLLRIGNGVKTATYHLKIIPTGPLAPLDVYEETTFSLKTGVLKLSLPVQNQYNNTYLNEITFRREDGQDGAVIQADGAPLVGCTAEKPNRLVIELHSPIQHVLKLGKYSIEIGSMKFPQRLVVID